MPLQQLGKLTLQEAQKLMVIMMQPCPFGSCLRILLQEVTTKRFSNSTTWEPFSDTPGPLAPTKEAAQALGSGPVLPLKPGPWPPLLWLLGIIRLPIDPSIWICCTNID